MRHPKTTELTNLIFRKFIEAERCGDLEKLLDMATYLQKKVWELEDTLCEEEICKECFNKEVYKSL